MSSHKFTFKKIRAKNFRSISNSWIEFDYTASPTTLIASTDNGSGKSTLSIFAPFYALFGKSYQKGSKIGSLINSRSNKESVVELEFSTKGSEWKVVRGQKPTVFEIYQDGVLLTNEASLKEPQAVLDGICGFDEKSFNSVIALGVDRFVPFTAFTAPERRVFVENMLDLIVISEMASNTKEKIKVIKKKIDQAFYESGTMESKLSGRQRTLQILNDKKQQRLAESGSEMDSFIQEETKVNSLLVHSNTKIDELNSSINVGAEEKQSSIKTMLDRFKYKSQDIKKNADSVIHLTDCPQCKQGVTEEHKAYIKANSEKDMAALVDPMTKLSTDLDTSTLLVNSNIETRRLIGEVRVIQAKLEARLKSTKDSINAIKAKMVNSNEDSLIEGEQKEIDLLSAEIEQKIIELNGYKTQETEYNQFIKILSDDGVKSNIVQQYLPFLVSDINNTLDKLNLYLNIDIDSDFNITMNTPSRKGQTLESLSSGQNRRVDLACLLAWRNIARKKASIDVNILVLDEVLENLSENGVSEFMDFWNETSDDINLFVVSQRHREFEEYFDRSVVYKLVDDATIIVGN